MNFAMRCLALLSFAAVSAGALAQQTRTCTEITSLPFTITASGSYCLNRSLEFSSTAIQIQASDVTIDFNGNTIFTTAAFAGQAVSTNSQQQRNITVRNGTIRGGGAGIALTGNDHLVENMRILDITNLGSGIDLSGNSGTVRNNFVRGVTSTGCCGNGISVVGTGSRVTGNQVIDMGTGTEEGIRAVGGGVLIEGNEVTNTNTTPVGGRPFYGILIAGGKATLARNYVHNYSMGIVASGASAMAIGNTVSGANTPFAGGVILGGSENLSF